MRWLLARILGLYKQRQKQFPLFSYIMGLSWGPAEQGSHFSQKGCDLGPGLLSKSSSTRQLNLDNQSTKEKGQDVNS